MDYMLFHWPQLPGGLLMKYLLKICSHAPAGIFGVLSGDGIAKKESKAFKLFQ